MGLRHLPARGEADHAGASGGATVSFLHFARLRKVSRRAAAVLSLELKLRMPSRTNAALTRVIIRLASPTSVSRSRLGPAWRPPRQASVPRPSCNVRARHAPQEAAAQAAAGNAAVPGRLD